ncbi:atrial natriuretic peptide receptor 1-like [Tachypleus tridentatus]|uniref:atrial natriuretic peptide receptor 1-like n=1 Tax=Tachypleus tridentatus TaxID=6853 RepID=UPI003FD4D621
MRQSLELALYEVDHEVHIGLHAFSRTARLEPNFTSILHEGSQYARVFILVAKGPTVRKILLAAHDLGMSDGEYAFLTIELFKNKRSFGDFSWFLFGDSRNEDARKIYESLMVFSVRVPSHPEYENFVKDVITRSNKEFNLTLDETAVNIILAGFHDCVMMYAWALNKTLAVGDDPLDGYSVIRRVWNTTFYGGLTGDVYISKNGDREADYTLSDLDPKTGEMKPVALFLGSRREYQPIDGASVHWPGGKGPPPEVPYCGFFGENPQCRVRGTNVLPKIIS